jgi:Transcriptional regulators
MQTPRHDYTTTLCLDAILDIWLNVLKEVGVMAGRREVAAAADVSLRTVSNVVNGYIHVAPETRARVLKVIEELDYRPSEVARSLKMGRSGLIGLMLPELDTPYFAELTRAFVEEGADRGLTVVIDQTDGDLGRERDFVGRADRGSLFDALILSPLALRPSDLAAVPRDRPIVFLGEDPYPGFDKVMIDNFDAARQMVSHLASIGRRRIAAIGAERTVHGSSSLRLAGYRQGLRDAGLAVDETAIEFVGAWRRGDGAAAMRRLLASAERPDAVFCFSDPLALGAIRALHEADVSVPDEVAVAGFDDIEDGRFATPSLTSITPDKHLIARVAFDRIVMRLEGSGGAAEEIVAPFTLTVRESTAGRDARAHQDDASDV